MFVPLSVRKLRGIQVIIFKKLVYRILEQRYKNIFQNIVNYPLQIRFFIQLQFLLCFCLSLAIPVCPGSSGGGRTGNEEEFKFMDLYFGTIKEIDFLTAIYFLNRFKRFIIDFAEKK